MESKLKVVKKVLFYYFSRRFRICRCMQILKFAAVYRIIQVLYRTYSAAHQTSHLFWAIFEKKLTKINVLVKGLRWGEENFPP